MKKIIAFMLVMLLALSVSFSVLKLSTVTMADTRELNNSRSIIDTDGSDGYSGDYVVIYNPATEGSVNSGTLSGSIDTNINGNRADAVQDNWDTRGIQMPYHPVNQELVNQSMGREDSRSYAVGSTRTFELISYLDWGTLSVEFKCLSVGDHCYVWTPTERSYHPLDSIGPDFGDTVRNTFESKYQLMIESFGNFYDPTGENKINLCYYNIDDGWTPGNSYVAGFYATSDYYNNNCAMINIDTYPLVEWVTTQGEYQVDLSSSFGVTMHEFQHLINANVSSGCDSWLNEMKSAAAEEITFPGSSVSNRIRSWLGTMYTELYDDYGNVSGLATEREYMAKSDLHKGATLYQWDSSSKNQLYTYAQASLFAQYLYSRAGTNKIFKQMSTAVENGANSIDAIGAGMDGTPLSGISTSQIVRDFRTALVANDAIGNDGRYGFKIQAGYTPAEYSNMDNLYDLLSPVVFIGTSTKIGAGGAIVVKPMNKNFIPPANAADTLLYTGVTINSRIPYTSSPRIATLEDEYVYVRATNIRAGDSYVVVCDGKYAMNVSFNNLELASESVEISDDTLISEVKSNMLWTFDTSSNGYCMQNNDNHLYLGSSNSGFPTLNETVPILYYYTYDNAELSLFIEGNQPSSIWRYLQGDETGFEFNNQVGAGKITLYTRVANDPAIVRGVSVTPNEIPVLMRGATTQLMATVLPQTSINKNCTWSSSNNSIVSVNDRGTVVGVADGNALITVTTEEGGYTATCKVTVKEPLAGAAANVEIQCSGDTYYEQKPIMLRALISPANYNPSVIKSINWYVADGLASISNASNTTQAILTAYKPGDVTVCVTVTNIDDTFCTGMAAISISQGDLQPPTDGVHYKLSNNIESGNEYVIVTKYDDKYYAICAVQGVAYPFAPQAKEVKVSDDGLNITSAQCVFDALEWTFEEKNIDVGNKKNIIGYSISWKDPAQLLVANTHSNLELSNPSMNCYWHLDIDNDGRMTLRQSKFAAWHNMALDIKDMQFTVLDKSQMVEDADYSLDIMLFEKETIIEPTSSPTLSPTTSPTPMVEPTPDLLMGDVNGNGVVNTGDVTCLLRYCIGSGSDGFIEEVADMNLDGEINTGDAVIILRLSLK